VRVGRTVLAAGVGVPLAAVAFLAGQAYWASTQDLPDLEPTYEVDALVDPGGTVTPAGDLDERRPDAAASAALRLVVLGDSTAAGTGVADLADALPVQIAARVAAALERPVAVTGFGVSGARTEGVIRDQVPLLDGTDPEVVVIVIGSNDVTGLTTPWALRRQTRELLEAAHAAADAPVVLAGIPLFRGAGAIPQPLRRVTVAYANRMRPVQREAAGSVEGVRYVPIADEASPRFAGRPEAMSADAYHPSPVGYGFWADAIAPRVVAAAADR
jgi:lysophospholipase L1-like esterase